MSTAKELNEMFTGKSKVDEAANLSQLKDSFSAISKNTTAIPVILKNLKPADLKMLGVEKEMGWQGKEFKLWSQIQKLVAQSTLGKAI